MKRFGIFILVTMVSLGLAAVMSGCWDSDGNGDGNTAPVANAGPDQNVVTGFEVTLDASGSSDAEGDSLTYLWSFEAIAGASTPAFSDSTAVDAAFMADTAGTYVVSLVVNDGSLYSVADSVTIIAGPASVALFINNSYVDYVDDPAGDEGYEAYNVLNYLQEEGLSYTTISGITSTDFSTGLAGRNALIIPELENDDLAADLSVATMGVIADFVLSGGTLISMGDYNAYGLTLVNALFGYSTAGTNDAPPISQNAVDAAGSRFEGGPGTLDSLSATHAVLTTTLPAGAMSMYMDTDGETEVALIEEGDGEVILLGWDWYDALPYGVEDGGWLEILNRCLGNY